MKKFIITEEEKSKILKLYLGEQSDGWVYDESLPPPGNTMIALAQDVTKIVDTVVPGKTLEGKFLTTLVVGVLGNVVIKLIEKNQHKQIKDLIERFKVVVDDLTEEEVKCLSKTNIWNPIKLINIKKLVNKEREISIWLGDCIKDTNKLETALSHINDVIKSYREEKDENGYYTH